jgi:predicted branched-subunit amino acid permease
MRFVPTANPSPLSEPIWRHPEFAAGARDMLGTAVGIAAWGLITGVAMGKSGLPLAVMVFMSLVVFAGSAQLVVLPLMSAGAPVWMIWATTLCVNLRFAIISALLRPYLAHMTLGQRLRWAYLCADFNYVHFTRRFPVAQPAPEQAPYYWGGAVLTWFSWQLPSLAGIFLADAVPLHWGIGFAGTLALLALACALLKGTDTVLAAAVAACAAVAAYALPYKMNILVAIAAAVAMGLLMEQWGSAARRAQP